MKYLGIATALALGNLLYQSLAHRPNYRVAFERSFFQAAALLIVWIMETYPE